MVYDESAHRLASSESSPELVCFSLSVGICVRFRRVALIECNRGIAYFSVSEDPWWQRTLAGIWALAVFSSIYYFAFVSKAFA